MYKTALFSSFLLASAHFASNAATVAYYRLEGSPGMVASGASTITDSSGNNLSGSPFGGPLYQADVPTSLIGGAPNITSMNFDGVNDRVAIADDPRFALTGSLTLEAFIKPRTGAFGGFGLAQIVLRGDDRGALDPYFLALSGNNILFHIENQFGAVTEVAAAVPSFNQWMHVAGTLNSVTNAMNLYINGTLVSSTSTAVRPFASLSGPLPGIGIGNVFSTSYDEYFNGNIDEVRISDVALNPSQFLSAVPESSTLIMFVCGSLFFSYRVGGNGGDRRKARVGGVKA